MDLTAPPPPDPTTLAHRVALRDLVDRYALAVDTRRSDDVAALFTHDGELVVPRVPQELGPTIRRNGRAEIAEAMASLERYVATTHAVVGHVVELRPEHTTAAGMTTCIAHHVRERDGALTSSVWGLHYEDDYRLDEGAWRFERRQLSVDWVEERPVSVARRLRGPEP